MQLDTAGLARFVALRADAVDAVTNRFYGEHGTIYEKFGPAGRARCHEDIAFHLEFLRPVLEFGLVDPMVEYLRWLESMLGARGIPVDHILLSLEYLHEFFADHMSRSDAPIVARAIRSVSDLYARARGAPPQPDALEAWPEAELFEVALIAGQQAQALQIVTGCIEGGRTLVEVEMHVIKPALYAIGEKWQLNQVSVATEHLATAIAQSVMTVGLMRAAESMTLGRSVLLACPEGNLHVVGLRMVADAFQIAGWDVQYLGANVPTKTIVQQVAERKPDLVALSVSFTQQLPAVKDVIAQLTQRLGESRPSVIVGGLAVNRFDRLAGMLGADAYGADPPAAVSYGGRLSEA